MKLSYNARASDKYISMKAGAKAAGVSYSRFRKALQRLKIDVVKVGWTVLVPRGAPERVRRAMRDGTIRRGRRKGAMTRRATAP